MTFAEFRTAGRLVLAHARRHPGRMLLTMCSTVAAACIVVWVVSGYDALRSKFDEFEDAYLGRYELLIEPVRNEGGFRMGGAPALDQTLLAQVRNDPLVAVADPLFQTQAQVRSPRQEPPVQPPAASRSRLEPSPQRPGRPPALVNPFAGGDGPSRRPPVLVGSDAEAPPHELLEGRWIDPRHPERLEGVLTAGSAEQLHVKVGDSVLVGGRDGTEVSIIGIVKQPESLPGPRFRIGLPPSREQALTGGPATAVLYVPMGTAADLTGDAPRHSFIGVVLKPGARADDFKQQWNERLARFSPPAEMESVTDVSGEIENSTTVEGVRSQAYAATGISLLAALFIIFTTLSMSVDERIRQFAMLRAIGLTKLQIGAMLAMESLILGVIGWGGGLLAGWGLLLLLPQWHPDLLQRGATLGTLCVLLSGACAVGGAILASILPAWKATRVRPLDAMAVRARPSSARIPWIAGVVGIVLVTVNPLLVFFIPMPDTARYAVSAAIGCLCMGLGFVLLCPLLIVLTEKWLGPVFARCLGLNSQLLSTQLTSNLWRTVGIVSSLTLGLGLFVAMQTWGYSMLAPFTPGSWVPDLIVGLTPAGIPESAVDEVRQVKGVVADKCVPLAVEQVKFAEDITGSKERATASRQDNCVMVGVDPERALGGARPLFDFRFVAGNREEAVARLKQGRYCLVPDHFQRESGLGVGDRFAIVPPKHQDEPIEYEIAGVVSMDGWHWMSKVGLRNRGGGRSAGLMFAPYSQVKQDFELDRVSFFWMNLDGQATEDEIQKSLQQVSQAHAGSARAGLGRRGPGFGSGGTPGVGGGVPPGFEAGGQFAGERSRAGNVQMRSADGVREAIRERADGIIWALSQLPLVTLAVTGLGVVNTIASSIRARRWDLGVLRSVGLTRWGLFRLILAEAILIGLVACQLSCGFGIMAGYCGTGVTRYTNIRGGLVTPLVIPWEQIGLGFGMMLLLCLLAALVPALMTARAEPLKLLQSGRGTV